MPEPTSTQPTTAQSLGALLKSARDIMRKDKGLNGASIECLGRGHTAKWRKKAK